VKLTRIDHLTLGDHYHLTDDDECYFLREYTARTGFEGSETNQIIHNIKKTPDRRSLPEWFYKEQDPEPPPSRLGAASTPRTRDDESLGEPIATPTSRNRAPFSVIADEGVSIQESYDEAQRSACAPPIGLGVRHRHRLRSSR
jgi:hypothetical protein